MTDSSWIRRRAAAALAALALTGTVLVPPASAAVAGGTAAEPAADVSTSYESIEIDASVERWTALRSGAPDNADGFGFAGDRFVGQCVGEGGIGCAADDVQRVAYDFGDLGSPEALADLQDGVIRSAHLTLDVVQDQGCGVQNVTVQPVSAVAEDSTWNTLTVYRSPTAPLSEIPCGGQEVRVDVTALVEHIVRGSQTLAFGLKAVDEGCRGCGRAAFSSAADLEVVLDMTDTVTDPQTFSYGVLAPCVTGAHRPAIGALRPTLTAVLTNEREPSASWMAAVFTVRDLVTGEEVQQVRTSPRPSGDRHSATVGPGVLAHSGTYAWTAQPVLPSGQLGDPVACEFSVDTEAPGVPTITAVEDYPAVYAPGAVSGGPFVPGAFALSADGDVAHFEYDFNTGQHGELAPGELLEYVPERSVSTRLTVRAVDAAGNVAVSEPYDFNVGFPATVGRWLFNEGDGATATGEFEGPVLGLSSEGLWGAGALGDFDPDDFGLVLDDPADSATSAGPLADPTGIVTVSAVVKPTDAGPGRIVSRGSDFELAVVTAPECPTTSGTCWAYTGATGTGTERTTVYADAEPVPGVWNTVTAIRNPHLGDVRMYFCRSDVWDRPQQVAQADIEPLETGSEAPLIVGGSSWTGTVDNLRVLSGVPDDEKIERWCTGSTGP